MIASVIHNDKRRFAEHLARLDPESRADAMMNAVVGANGIYQRTRTSSAGRHIFTLKYLDIHATGFDQHAAIQQWIRKARQHDHPHQQNSKEQEA